MTLDDRYDHGAELLEQMLGKEAATASRESWAAISPDLDQYITGFVFGEIWDRAQLDRRSKSLVTIATVAGLGRTLALELNLRMALKNGASRQEIVETLLHIAPYAGFPAAWEGLVTAARVFKELDEAQS